MPTVVKAITATGGSDPVRINLTTFRRGVGLLVNVPDTSSATYDVEVTGDDPGGALSVWNKHDILQGQTESANSNLAFPVTAVRINPSSITGTIYCSVIQVEG